MREFEKFCSDFFFFTFISKDIFNEVCICPCMRVVKEQVVITFSPFRVIETPSKLKIKTNIHVNSYIREKISIGTCYPPYWFSVLPAFVSPTPPVFPQGFLFLFLSLVQPFCYYLKSKGPLEIIQFIYLFLVLDYTLYLNVV